MSAVAIAVDASSAAADLVAKVHSRIWFPLIAEVSASVLALFWLALVPIHPVQ
jgi:hypothetical protein